VRYFYRFGSDAATELPGRTHNDIRCPLARDGEQIGDHCRSIYTDEDAGDRPIDASECRALRRAREEFVRLPHAVIEARREGVEACLFHDRNEGRAAAKATSCPAATADCAMGTRGWK